MASNRRKRRTSRAQDNRRFTVRGLRRNPMDIGKFSKGLVELAEAERDAQADHGRRVREDSSQEDASADQPQQPNGGVDAT